MNHVLICTSDGSLSKTLSGAAEQVGLEVHSVGKAQSALKIMTEQQPALVLMDQAFETGTGLVVASNLIGLNSRARIMLLVRDGSFDLTRDALRIGVADLLVIPNELPRVAELLATINRSVESEGSHFDGRSLAYFSVKGGVGASFLAANGAVALTKVVSGPVLLIDGNMQKADLSAILDVKSDRNVTDLLPVLDELTPGHIRDVCATHVSGVHILLAPADLALSYSVLPEHLARIVRVARRQFAAVVIDCPPLTDERCKALLEEASTPVMVVTPDALNVIHWRRLKVLTGMASGRIKVVLNQMTTRSEFGTKEMSGLLQLPVIDTVRYDAAAAVFSVNEGKTLFETPKAKGVSVTPLAKDVFRVTRRLLG